MAQTQSEKIVTFEAGADLRTAKSELVTLNADGQLVKADAATDIVVGIVAAAPSAAADGTPVGVALIGAGGILKAKASGAIAAGAILVPTATAGKANDVANRAALAAGQVGIGITLEAATAADEVISFAAFYIASAT